MFGKWKGRTTEKKRLAGTTIEGPKCHSNARIKSRSFDAEPAQLLFGGVDFKLSLIHEKS